MVKIPRPPVYEFGFKEVKVCGNEKFEATCKFCTYGKKSMTFTRQSAFTLRRHLQKQHPVKFKEFQASEKAKKDSIIPKDKKKLEKKVMTMENFLQLKKTEITEPMEESECNEMI